MTISSFRDRTGIWDMELASDRSSLVLSYYKLGDTLGREYSFTIYGIDLQTGSRRELMQGMADVKAIAAGPGRFPFLAVARGDETVIRMTVGQRAVAFFPIGLGRIQTHPEGRIWAGRGTWLSLIRLEGETYSLLASRNRDLDAQHVPVERHVPLLSFPYSVASNLFVT